MEWKERKEEDLSPLKANYLANDFSRKSTHTHTHLLKVGTLNSSVECIELFSQLL